MKKLTLILTLVLILMYNISSFAGGKIPNITLELSYPNQVSSTNDISINMHTPNCSIESTSYELSTNRLTVLIRADNGYEFALTRASEVNVFGAKYITARKEGSRYLLSLTVELESQGIHDDAGWKQENGNWVYRENDGSLKTGWFNDGISLAWYYFDENGIMVTNSWVDYDGKKYYLSSGGIMMRDTVTPDGIYVGEDGAATTDVPEPENVKSDILSYISNGEVVTIPCNIHYKNDRITNSTALHYDSVEMQDFNGRTPNLIVTYTVLRTGGNKGIFLNIDIYVNGEKKTSLEGREGNAHVNFNKNSAVIELPYDFLTPSNTVDIYIR